MWKRIREFFGIYHYSVSFTFNSKTTPAPMILTVVYATSAETAIIRAKRLIIHRNVVLVGSYTIDVEQF